MALRRCNESEDEYYYRSASSGHDLHNAHRSIQDDIDQDSDIEGPPIHPVSAMQDAFEESIFESAEDDSNHRSESSIADRDPETRRQKLLQTKHYDDSWTTRWKQAPGARHHPLLKLMAQIVFGMHLLHQQQAKSNEEVVKILQNHVDDVDGFLEKTTEDLNLAISDIEERLRNLKLPMTHLDVFDIMLDDKKFRTELVAGNDKIEKIIDRTAKAMGAALLDVQKGIEAVELLGRYLENVRDEWPKDKGDLRSIYSAMCGNEQGWIKALNVLQAKGKTLGDLLRQLGTVIGELSKLAAAASRRNKAQSQAILAEGNGRDRQLSTSPQSKYSRRKKLSLDKPLPLEPGAAPGASRTPSAKAHPVPYAERFETPRQQPLPPRSPQSMKAKQPDRPTHESSPPRPKTALAMAPRDPQVQPQSSTAELASFLKHSDPRGESPYKTPLRSHTEPTTTTTTTTPTVRKPTQSKGITTTYLHRNSRTQTPSQRQQHIATPPPSTTRTAADINQNLQHATATAIATPVTTGTAEPRPSTPTTALPPLENKPPELQQSPARAPSFARRRMSSIRRKKVPSSLPAEEGKAVVNAADSQFPNEGSAAKGSEAEVERPQPQRSGSRLGLFPASGGPGSTAGSVRSFGGVSGAGGSGTGEGQAGEEGDGNGNGNGNSGGNGSANRGSGASAKPADKEKVESAAVDSERSKKGIKGFRWLSRGKSKKGLQAA
ncbi:hypothetical protein MBLNU230_g3567t1 [Neophaeotheca triangularis]